MLLAELRSRESADTLVQQLGKVGRGIFLSSVIARTRRCTAFVEVAPSVQDAAGPFVAASLQSPFLLPRCSSYRAPAELLGRGGNRRKYIDVDRVPVPAFGDLAGVDQHREQTSQRGGLRCGKRLVGIPGIVKWARSVFVLVDAKNVRNIGAAAQRNAACQSRISPRLPSSIRRPSQRPDRLPVEPPGRSYRRKVRRVCSGRSRECRCGQAGQQVPAR